MKIEHSPEFRHLSEPLQAAVEDAVIRLYNREDLMATVESDDGATAVAYWSSDGLRIHWYTMERKVTMQGTSSWDTTSRANS